MQTPLRCLLIAQNAITAEIAEWSLVAASVRPVETVLLANPWEPPAELWTTLRSERFDLIVADVPRATWVLYDWLREVGAARQVPIAVVMLGMDMDDADQVVSADLQPTAMLSRGAGATNTGGCCGLSISPLRPTDSQHRRASSTPSTPAQSAPTALVPGPPFICHSCVRAFAQSPGRRTHAERRGGRITSAHQAGERRPPEKHCRSPPTQVKPHAPPPSQLTPTAAQRRSQAFVRSSPRPDAPSCLAIPRMPIRELNALTLNQKSASVRPAQSSELAGSAARSSCC